MIPDAGEAGLVTTSNLVLGKGETYEEAVQALGDLHEAGCPPGWASGAGPACQEATAVLARLSGCTAG